MSDVAVWHSRSTVNQHKINNPNWVLPTPHANTREVNVTAAWATLNLFDCFVTMWFWLVATSLWLEQCSQRRWCLSPQVNTIIRLVKPAEKAWMKDRTTIEKMSNKSIYGAVIAFRNALRTSASQNQILPQPDWIICASGFTHWGLRFQSSLKLHCCSSSGTEQRNIWL